jgi:N6-L-threonylcarbamoyladenine synthase
MLETPLILAIESSCDETSAAVLQGLNVLSNIVSTQKIHEKFGGVVPELASRAHQASIVPVVEQAIAEAKVDIKSVQAVAVTLGPGLMGALLVGTSFAKSLSLSLNIPLISVNHMHAHVLAHFIQYKEAQILPKFPMLCLTVSGGHTQIVLVSSPLEMQVIGETIDDAAGEAFDKAAKVLGLPYPGGPQIDKLAFGGDEMKFNFTSPRLDNLRYSFSGLKTSLLYFLKAEMLKNPDFIQSEVSNICASYQRTIIDYLLVNFETAMKRWDIKNICLAGGVSANSLLRRKFLELGNRHDCATFIPEFQFCTDNAAMVGAAAYFKFQVHDFASLDCAPKANWSV